MKFCYDQKTDEFIQVSETQEEPTGNRVFISGTSPEIRFKVEIDDFGHVLAALNRLVLQFIPTFKWPTQQEIDAASETQKQADPNDMIPSGTGYKLPSGKIMYYHDGQWGDDKEPGKWTEDKVLQADPNTGLPLNPQGEQIDGEFV